MHILENVPLNQYSTMRLGGSATYLTEISTRQELTEAIAWAAERQLPVIMIGVGSNIIWEDTGYPGLVLVDRIPGFEISGEFGDAHYITIGSGVNWDKAVAKTVELGLTGIEFLSLIPGTAGATPVQNVGAYGTEISNTLVTLEAYDRQTKQFATIRADECGFGYRTSRFKTTDHGRFFIVSITLSLQKNNPTPPFYGVLQNYLNEHNITDITPATIREAVITIRSEKLPDPAVVANNGSFFANPIINKEAFIQLAADYPDMPHWEVPSGVKIAAAWLLEQTGFKDYHDNETGMGTWPKQPLVFVNEHAETTAQLKVFKQKVIDAVQQKFDIVLEQEPELI